MGREVRRVTPNYEHPKDGRGNFVPLFDDFENDLASYEQRIKEHGLRDAVGYYGGGPSPEDYMLVEYRESDDCYYGVEGRTWFMAFETVSEGTPTSPAFETQEELARYLSEHGDFAYQQGYSDISPKPTYQQALEFVTRGSVPSMIFRNGELKNTYETITQDSIAE